MAAYGCCQANNNRTDVDDDKTNTIWYCNYCKIIVTNGDVKMIYKIKIQILFIGFSLGCPPTGAKKQRKSLSRNL